MRPQVQSIQRTADDEREVAGLVHRERLIGCAASRLSIHHLYAALAIPRSVAFREPIIATRTIRPSPASSAVQPVFLWVP